MTGIVAVAPLVEELVPAPSVLAALQSLSDLDDVVLMESRGRSSAVSRYSFLAADPFAFVELDCPGQGQDPFVRLREFSDRFHSSAVPGLPPFQGGAAGILGYELGGAWERLSFPEWDEFALPVLAVGLYDWVIAWDHQSDRAWVISQGFPETDPARRQRRASDRLAEVQTRLRGTDSGPDASPAASTRMDLRRMAPCWPAEGPDGLLSDFSRESYLAAVEAVIDYIHAGDIFQANLSQRLLFPQATPASELYARLRQCNPAPFAGYVAHDDWALVSASPERFVCLQDGAVETRPIKGTRPRQDDSQVEVLVRGDLYESQKDQAENVMIVDLLRNDLSKVCLPGTLRVPRLCELEVFETVMHLVSEVRGVLQPGCNAWDLLAAVFPGGSITGAPKIRAMEIIAELEPTARGPYCGSLFYVGFDGNLDSSILIRTFTVRHGWVQCSVGGGIVAQSDPVAEFNETLDKAAGMLRVL